MYRRTLLSKSSLNTPWVWLKEPGMRNKVTRKEIAKTASTTNHKVIPGPKPMVVLEGSESDLGGVVSTDFVLSISFRLNAGTGTNPG